ncbi:MAG: class I SAM-dependent methyltransferase [Gammaproteobacteria bacterium]
MLIDGVPPPAVMPVDSEKWASELPLSAFVNAHYQYRDLQTLGPCHEVLVVGPGQGLVPALLRWRGYTVTTLDIDPALNPDHVGSVHDMAMFGDRQFDVVIASHVLEHFAVPYLDRALAEIARVGRHALIYLPVRGRHVSLRFIPDVRNLDFSLVTDLYNYLERPDGVTARYMEGQHFWEVGMRGFRVRDLLGRLKRKFEVLSHYRNRDWLPSYNFVLRSRAGSGSGAGPGPVEDR